MADQPDDQPAQHADTLDLINNEMAASLDRQRDSLSKVDTKAVILVGYAGTASAFLATHHVQHDLAILAYAGFGLAVVFGISAYRLRSYLYVPNPRILFNNYWNQPKADVLAMIAASRVEVFESLARHQERKGTLWWFSLASLTVGMIFMILALTGRYW
jgi:hypothetical protein